MMKKFFFCMISIVSILGMGEDMSGNYYNYAATSFDDLSQASSSQVRGGKITCFDIIPSTGSSTYEFNSSLCGKITAVVGGDFYIDCINDIKVPTFLLLDDAAKSSEWVKLSKMYLNIAISKISFLGFFNMEIVKKGSIDFIIENIDGNSFSIFCPSSKRKRMVRYSSNKLLQLRDYAGEQFLQEINFYPEETSIYRIYVLGKCEVVFFRNGGIQRLTEYDDNTKKAIRARAWTMDGTFLGERDLIKNPINYNEIKIKK